MAQQLRILVLANCPRDEIAARLQIDEQIVAVIEDLFFDIRWALDASSWIVCRVIIPEMQTGAWDASAKFRLAYYGGPVMARAILDARVRVPFDGADRLFDREVLLHVKLQEAPLGDRERMEFLKFYLDFDIKRQRLELDKKKFAYKCEQDELRGVTESQSRETAAGNPEDGESSSESDPELQEGDSQPVVVKDLWKRLVA